MSSDYRNIARGAIQKAKNLLITQDADQVRYAVLELRMAIEGLTYARVNAYKKDIPPSEYQTWQPKKILELLIEIEPMVDQRSTISFGMEESYGKPAEKMTMLGTEEIFNLKLIKKHYDALGSYLHLPTINLLEKSSSFDVDKITTRCEQIISEIELVLSSKVFNTTFGSFAEMSCERCSQIIRKRLNSKKPIDEAVCFNCDASYLIEADTKSDKVTWQPKIEKINCLMNDCQTEISVWHRDIKEGRVLQCTVCKTKHVIGLSVTLEGN